MKLPLPHAFAPPRLTLRCECGTEGLVGYGDQWTCPNCGRNYDTSHIPSEDYDRILALNRRYTIGAVAVVAVLAVIVLVIAITGQIVTIFAGLALTLLGWFLFIKPVIHRRHKNAVGDLVRNWDLEAE